MLITQYNTFYPSLTVRRHFPYVKHILMGPTYCLDNYALKGKSSEREEPFQAGRYGESVVFQVFFFFDQSFEAFKFVGL